MTESDEKNWGMAAHLASLAGLTFPFGNILGPLVVWLMKKDESEFVNEQGKESLNFQISFMIYFLIIFSLIIGLFILISVLAYDSASFPITTFTTVFLLMGLFFLVYIVQLIFVIIASVKVSKGEHYRYPVTIRFFR